MQRKNFTTFSREKNFGLIFLNQPFLRQFFALICSGAVLLVYANKQDLQGAATAAELRDKLELDKVCKDRSWYVQPCCALTGDGLLHGLEWLAQELKKVKG